MVKSVALNESDSAMSFPSEMGVARLLLIAAIMIAGSAQGQAGVVIYNQTSNYPSNFNAITSQSQATGGNYQSYDNFTLGTGASIGSLTFQGFFWDPRSQSVNPVNPSSMLPLNFQIAFFQNTNNLPGSLAPLGGPISLTGIQMAQVGTASFGPDNTGHNDTVDVLNFTANLSTAFSALANTTYWLSIVSFTPPPVGPPPSNAVWLWTSGTGGDGKSAQLNYGQPNPVYITGDRAFSLSTGQVTGGLLGSDGPTDPPTGQLLDAVPEPGSLAIMGTLLLGCGAMIFWRRRKVGLPG